MTVWTSTWTTGSSLNTEQITQQSNNEITVQISILVPDDKRNYTYSVQFIMRTKNDHFWIIFESLKKTFQHFYFSGMNTLEKHVFDQKSQTCFNSLHDSWSSRLLSILNILSVNCYFLADEIDCAPSTMGGIQITRINWVFEDGYATRSWSS